MAASISPAVCPPLPPPHLECCHGVNGKLIVVQSMRDVLRRKTLCDRTDDKAVVRRCLASVMSAYVLHS